MMKKFGLYLFMLLLSSQLAAQEYSYLWANQYPALAEPAIVCCFDFDDDMTDDDQSGDLLAAIEGLIQVDFQIIADEMILNNEYVRIWRWDELPADNGSVTLSLLTGTVDNPGSQLQDRIDGFTQVIVDPAAISVFTGTMDNGFIDLYAEIADGLFFTPLPSFSNPNRQQGTAAGFDIEVPLLQARITGTINQNVGGCQGVCGETTAATDPALLGALEISGLIHHADEIDAINTIATTCACAGISDDMPMLSYVEDSKSLEISCNYDNLTPDQCSGEFAYCESVSSQCSFATLLTINYDQDSNNNGVSDSKSVGGLIGLSGATVNGVVDLIFEHGFE